MQLAEYAARLQSIMEKHPEAAACQVVTATTPEGVDVTLRESVGYTLGEFVSHGDGTGVFVPAWTPCQPKTAICLWP